MRLRLYVYNNLNNYFVTTRLFVLLEWNLFSEYENQMKVRVTEKHLNIISTWYSPIFKRKVEKMRAKVDGVARVRFRFGSRCCDISWYKQNTITTIHLL